MDGELVLRPEHAENGRVRVDCWEQSIWEFFAGNEADTPLALPVHADSIQQQQEALHVLQLLKAKKPASSFDDLDMDKEFIRWLDRDKAISNGNHIPISVHC